ncbi:hypothetical protein OSB04_031027 [Centaurea solstitialis]|uniref:NAC domain-containing protein n=1 Tax=Centaurea solstitialis TaxID=347529 RepID=A0AA38W5K6_9ASTR|nr:hypothetical protein OSB04_031027 [Centaurea solstitialis]
MEINQRIVPYTSSSNQPEGDYADNLHPGYKFLPSDLDLIVHYLKPKIATGTHPPCRLHEVFLYDHHPQQLSELYRAASENTWYFLTSRERRYPKGKRPKRSTKGFGRWKASQKYTTVCDRQMVVGYKRNLAFHDEKDDKTEWLMHEYTTDDPTLPFGSGQNGKELNKYVLCKVYKKETGNRSNRDQNQAEEIQNVGNREEVERGSPSVPVNHGNILEPGTMNTSDHQNPIMQPFVTSHGSTQSVSEDPNYQGFRRQVRTRFMDAPPLPADGYINNHTVVPLSPSPVNHGGFILEQGTMNTTHHPNPMIQPACVTSQYGSSSTQSTSGDPNHQGFRGEVQPSFTVSFGAAPPPPPPALGYNTTVVMMSPSPVSISSDAHQQEYFENGSGSNYPQSVTQDATNNDHIPEPSPRPWDYKATNQHSLMTSQDASNHIPQPSQFDYEAVVFSLDHLLIFDWAGQSVDSPWIRTQVRSSTPPEFHCGGFSLNGCQIRIRADARFESELMPDALKPFNWKLDV